MDALLRASLDQIFRRHRVPVAAREALVALVHDLLDPRLQLTEAGPDEGSGAAEDPWEDLGRIGRGGMGEVRRVRERRLGRVVAMKLLRDEGQLGWFDREARITASMDHPGVPPVFQYGRLADGRPFFTLREVQGRTLREVLDEPTRDQRALLIALRRAADTVAYAHAQGLVHCDLKPENLVLGDFGEVWVIDWGIARAVGETAAPGTGSPRYMAPEQARGEPLTRATDVWALGALLYEILTGRPAFRGELAQLDHQRDSGPPPAPGLPAPPELSRLTVRALTTDPAGRLADAAAFAHALGAWLAGRDARSEAEVTLEEARAAFAHAAAQRAAARAAEQEAEARLAALPSWAPLEEKAPGWELQARARQLEDAAAAEEANAAELARAALQRFSELDAAHDLLAQHYRQRLELAEREADPAAARLEASLRAHDRGAHTAWLEGTGAVTLHTDPPGARVTAYPMVEVARRLVEGPPRPLGRTPLDAVPLPRGSWILRVEAEGRPTVRYPVAIGRMEHWHGVPPGGDRAAAIPLPPLADDEIYIPAGWTPLGGDPRANLSLPETQAWVPGFVMRRFLTTNREWLAYLHALVAAGRIDDAMRAVPRERSAGPQHEAELIYGFDGARFFLKPDSDGDLWELDWPVIHVNWHQANSYAAWLAETTGAPWRLPWQVENEKASRGVDRRIHPWGNAYDPTFSRVALSAPGRPRPAVVDSYPTDVSVYGVRGVAGNARVWLLDLAPEGRVYAAGSYWNAGGATGRCAARWAYMPHQRNSDTGVRVVRPLDPDSALSEVGALEGE